MHDSSSLELCWTLYLTLYADAPFMMYESCKSFSFITLFVIATFSFNSTAKRNQPPVPAKPNPVHSRAIFCEMVCCTPGGDPRLLVAKKYFWGGSISWRSKVARVLPKKDLTKLFKTRFQDIISIAVFLQ